MATSPDMILTALQNGVVAINDIDTKITSIDTTLSSIDTTLNTTLGSIDASISSINASISSISTSISAIASAATPWIAYTPAITALAGTFTTVSATGTSKQIGSVIFVHIRITITTNNTAAGYVIATLPVASVASAIKFYGRAETVSGKMLQGFSIGPTSVAICNYDNSYPGADGEVLDVTGLYEVTA